jgi:peptidoglycan/LPS O-acetylase OafA/YrhL
VVAYHYVYLESRAHVVTQFGFMGVHLFFVISGFVILWTAQKKDGYEFLASRISRIYPSFWVSVVLTAGAFAVAGNAKSLRTVLANLTIFPGLMHEPILDGVYWTLQIEWKFYLVFLLLIATQQLRWIEGWLWIWLALAMLQTPWLSLSGYAPLFVAGCFLYLIYSRGATLWRATGLVASFIFSEWVALTTQAGFTHNDALYVKVGVVAILAMCIGVFYLIARGRIHFPTWRGWYWLGSLTYPLYLVHYEMAGATLGFLPDVWWRQWLSLVLAIAVAAILAALSERRLCPMFDRSLLRLREAAKGVLPARRPA